MYAELHAKTNFSFLAGASHPDELVRRAAELNYAALAITDRHSLAGVVRAHGAAKDLGLKLLIGAEIAPTDAPPVVLLATDRAAYGRLARLITLGCRRAEKGDCRLRFEDVSAHGEGLLAAVLGEEDGRQNEKCKMEDAKGELQIENCKMRIANWKLQIARRMPPVPNPRFPIPNPQSEIRNLKSEILRYREAFGDRCYLLAELHRGPDDQRRLQRLSELARQTGVPLAAAGGVRYHLPQRQALCDVLTAIRLGCTVDEAGEQLLPNAERHLRPPAEIAALFAAAPAAVAQTLEIAARCTFSLDELRYEYPEELVPAGQTPSEHLRRLTWAGAAERYAGGVPAKVAALLEHELTLIEQLRYEAYFLTVWDLVQFARRRGILCQGRGSAANSAVCFCLGVTAVDPEQMDVLFERFVSRERNEAPDIDIDFEHERREEVLQYLYAKYGRERAGMTAEVITYRSRSAVRDVGKALGFPPEQVDALARQLEHFHSATVRSPGTGSFLGTKDVPVPFAHESRENGTVPVNGCFRSEPDLPERCRAAGMDPQSLRGGQLVALVEELVGFPRHLSQHTGGMVITRGPLCELVPIENAAMPERTVIQWNKDDLDELGILKVDCLALGMLTAIRKCFDLVRQSEGRALSLATIPPDDEDVYAMIRRADTMGVFQIESRAQMSMLPRLQPRRFYDLVIEVAIVRPGPIQGDMVHPYLRRRNGEEAVTFPNEAVRAVLEKTLGVPLFQEQAMRLAVVAAGFTPGEADQLRRAMGAWRRPGLIDQFRKRLMDGMQARGFTPEYAASVFAQIRGFGDYGFPESHAASFALLVYASAWLKHHYPAAFTAALLNSQPMGFYAPAQLVRNAREHGVEVRPPDVNASAWDCTLEPLSPHACAVRLGLRMLTGMSLAQAETVLLARGNRPFRSLEDFAQRTRLGRAAAMRLAKADAFASLMLDRRAALWDALEQDLQQTDRPLLADIAEDRADLPPLTPAEEVLADYRAVGLSLRAHPLSFLRADLAAMGVAPARSLAEGPDDRNVCVAGIVLVRQRPSTAKGITFVTLEDETGTANLIVRPAVWKRFRTAALGATLLLVAGRLQRQGEVIHVLVTRLDDLSARLAGLGAQSRDFC